MCSVDRSQKQGPFTGHRVLKCLSFFPIRDFYVLNPATTYQIFVDSEVAKILEAQFILELGLIIARLESCSNKG